MLLYKIQCLYAGIYQKNYKMRIYVLMRVYIHVCVYVYAKKIENNYIFFYIYDHNKYKKLKNNECIYQSILTERVVRVKLKKITREMCVYDMH